MSRLVEEFGTGYVRTAVWAHDTGFQWLRSAGPDRPAPLGRPDARLHAALRDVPGLVLPDAGVDQSVLSFRTGAPASLAAYVIGEEQDGVEPATALAGAAAALAELHRIPAPAGLPGPSGALRLVAWLATGDGPRAARQLHEQARAVLGDHRLSRYGRWCAEAVRGTALLHGAPGTGVVVPGSGVLTGEELAVGAVEWDLAWLVGELVEFRDVPRHTTGRGTLRALDYDALIATVLDAYPDGYDPAAVGRYAVLRLLLHAHDFAAYMGWIDVLPGYLATVAEVTDTVGSGRMVGAPA